DSVNNCATAGPFTGIKVDRKTPSVSCGSADGAWHPTDVSIACTASDGGSGLASSGDASFSLSTAVADGTETSNASTGSRNVCDAVSHCVIAGPIGGNKVDRKAPQPGGCDSPDGTWHTADVILPCTFTDGGSGPAVQVVALTTTVAGGTETDDAVASANGGNRCDAMNNCAASPSDIGGNKVDMKAPSVSCSSADGAWHGDDVSIG